MSGNWLADLPRLWRQSGCGLASVCSAHPWVIQSALSASNGAPILIEATCNQVNQFGGYTGVTPAEFSRSVMKTAGELGVDSEIVFLGGDHLGPNPWRELPAEEALRHAETMVEAYVAAGFRKLHLDTSMGCQGEPAALDDTIVSERAARLARVAEAAASDLKVNPPLYVIGTEVPSPGGSAFGTHTVAVTGRSSAEKTLRSHRDAFASAGIAGGFDRVIALVVQPGVEFGTDEVVHYERDQVTALTGLLAGEPKLVFEAHSTDYQTPANLAALVADGFAILKVGPALTFALREALYGLDRIACELDPNRRKDSLEVTMETLMLSTPKHWCGYYEGDPGEQRVRRHYSYSDRIRYYWALPSAQAAVARLLASLDSKHLPSTLISQFLSPCAPAVRDGRLAPEPLPLIFESIRLAFDPYLQAVAGEQKGIENCGRSAR
jgi:D-tagatose-1,6-bisphosphate aldolase subunit GatZ/KbaZ